MYVSITPANDCWAIYQKDGEPHAERVYVWALSDQGDAIGLVRGGNGGRLVPVSDRDPLDFVCYWHSRKEAPRENHQVQAMCRERHERRRQRAEAWLADHLRSHDLTDWTSEPTVLAAASNLRGYHEPTTIAVLSASPVLELRDGDHRAWRQRSNGKGGK